MTDPAVREEPAPGAEARGEWRTALALLLVILGTSVVGPGILAGLPFIALVAVLPVPRKRALLLAAAIAFLVFGARSEDSMWYFERGWGVLLSGWFLGITLRWPAWSLTSRALGAVGGAAAVAAAVFAARPGMWSAVDWQVKDRLTMGVQQALTLLEQAREEALPSALETSVLRTAEVQGTLFPAFLGLASLAGLGVAWWGYRRIAAGQMPGLGRLREFRFNDQLVWLLIGGLASLMVGAEGVERAGSNAVVFMGALYALRGAAVVLFLNGGITFFGAVIVLMGLLFVAPILLAGALLVGVSDTWLDVRNRVRESES